MKPLSEKFSSIQPSKTVALDTRAKKMIKEGRDVINLGSGEPAEATPDSIKAAAIKAIESGWTKYSSPTGISRLKTAVSHKLERDNHLKYTPDQILITSGAKHAVFNSLAVLLNPGDEVIIPSPHWVTYPSVVKLLGANPVYLEGDKSNHYKISPDSLAGACTSKTKALILNSPCNPTGAVYNREELVELSRVITDRDIYCITDEIYEHLIYDNSEHISMSSLGDDLAERTILINGVSKAFAMTGYRIGYAAASKKIAGIMGAFQSQSTHHPSTPAQFAAVEALDHGLPFTGSLVRSLKDKRELVTGLLSDSSNLSFQSPQGAFYFFIDVSKILAESITGSSEEFCDYLLKEHLVSLVPGSAFGIEGAVRISFTASREDLQKGIERILKGINSLEAGL